MTKATNPLANALAPTTARPGLSATELYKTRLNYYLYANQVMKSAGIDLLTKNSYGKLDPDHGAILIEPSFLKSFRSNTNLTAVNFVVDAFENFASYIARRAATTPWYDELRESPIVKMVPARAHIDFNIAYENFLNTLYNTFVTHLRRHDKIDAVVDFETFISAFRSFYLTRSGRFPITKYGYINSFYCPVHVSGLVIDLETPLSQDDERKYIITGKNNQTRRDAYDFFVNAARQHGFLIDFNEPTRLVCNLNSPVTAKYFGRYSTTGPPIYNADGQETVDENGHLHYIDYTLFGDHRGMGYTGQIYYEGSDRPGSAALLHRHRIKDFFTILPAKFRSRAYTGVGADQQHYHTVDKITRANLFEKYFQRIESLEIDSGFDLTGTASYRGLREIFFNFYQRFVKRFPNYKTVSYSSRKSINCGSPTNRRESKFQIIPRASLEIEEYNIKNDFNYWLPLFIELRFLESNMNITKSFIKEMVLDFHKVAKKSSFSSSMRILDRRIRKIVVEQALKTRAKELKK